MTGTQTVMIMLMRDSAPSASRARPSSARSGATSEYGNLFLFQNAQNIHKGEHIYCDVDDTITHINCDVDKIGLICLNWSITIMIGSGSAAPACGNNDSFVRLGN